MKKPVNEVIYDAPIDAVDNFAKEFDGLDDNTSANNAIQETWNSGVNQNNDDPNLDDRQARNVNDRVDS